MKLFQGGSQNEKDRLSQNEASSVSFKSIHEVPVGTARSTLKFLLKILNSRWDVVKDEGIEEYEEEGKKCYRVTYILRGYDSGLKPLYRVIVTIKQAQKHEFGKTFLMYEIADIAPTKLSEEEVTALES